MGDLLSADDFNQLWRYFRQTAFRLEVQPVYTVADEQESVGEFLTGHEPRPLTEYGWFAAWLDQIRSVTAQGREVRRVRVLDEPLTNYQRWEMWCGRWNIEAGEDIRYITRTRAKAAGLPVADDWWLFDSAAVAKMRFTADGHPLGGQIIRDPSVVSQYCAWRDLAVHLSDQADGNIRQDRAAA